MKPFFSCMIFCTIVLSVEDELQCVHCSLHFGEINIRRLIGIFNWCVVCEWVCECVNESQ